MVDAQDLSNVVTLILAGATVWLAIDTRRMANAAKDSIQLQSTPYLAIAALDLKAVTTPSLSGGTQTSLRFALRLSNPGQVLVNYEVESVDVVVEGTQSANPQFDNRGGVVHPKAETQFFYPWLQHLDIRPGMSAEITFRINYWASKLCVYHLEARLRYVLQSLDPPHSEWVFLDGPTYA